MARVEDVWVGCRWHETGLLILGESSYRKEGTEVWRPDYRKQQSIGYVQGQWDAKLERNITSTIAGRAAGEVRRQDVWATFAMDNYISDSLVEIPPGGDRPVVTRQQWRNAALRLPPLLSELQPTHVLVLGKGLFGWVKDGIRMNEHRDKSKIEDLAYHTWNAPTGLVIAFLAINHPSGTYGYDWRKWHPLVRQFLAIRV